jgi:hypothetical protein
MSLATIQAADFASITADLGSPVFTWSSEDYVCIPSGQTKSRRLEPGGLALDSDISLRALKSAFGTGPLPAEKQLVTFRGVSYRISSVVTNESNIFVVLNCLSANKGI